MSDQQKKREPPISMSLADVEADPELAARLTDKEKMMIAQGVPMGIAWFGPKHEIEKSVAIWKMPGLQTLTWNCLHSHFCRKSGNTLKTRRMLKNLIAGRKIVKTKQRIRQMAKEGNR